MCGKVSLLYFTEQTVKLIYSSIYFELLESFLPWCVKLIIPKSVHIFRFNSAECNGIWASGIVNSSGGILGDVIS